MKRFLCILLIGIMLLLPIGMRVSAVPDVPSTRANDEPTVEEIKKQIDIIYQKSLKSYGKSFNGWCGAYVGWQLKHMGINASYIGAHGKDTWEKYSKMTMTSGGYAVSKYPASQYTLKQALNKLSANGTKNVYNIMVCMQKGNSPLSYEYGHVGFIHAIIDGTIYFSESADLTLSGKDYSSGSVIAMSINRFCDNFYMLTGKNKETGAKLVPVFEGVIHFTGGSGPSLSDITCSWSKDSSKAWVKDTNVQVSAKVVMSGADISDITQEGMSLYDYKGSLLGSYEANVNPSGSDTTVYLYYDINKRLGYTLLPGTSYQYKTWITIGATKYESGVYSFKTTGTHSHSWASAEKTDPGCEKAGEIMYGCVSCSETKSETIPATGHNMQETSAAVPAACETAGKTAVLTCANCGKTEGGEEIPALGHSFENGVCTVCGQGKYVVGDGNGDGKVNLKDAILAMQAANGKDVAVDRSAADVNGDGKVNLKDAILILKRANGNKDPFPAEK